MSVSMPNFFFAHVRSQVSACRQFWTRGPACQSLVGLHNMSGLRGSHVPFPLGPHGDVAWPRMLEFWWARMSELGGPDMLELGGPACQSLLGLHNMSGLRGSHVPFPSGPHGDVSILDAWPRMSELDHLSCLQGGSHMSVYTCRTDWAKITIPSCWAEPIKESGFQISG